MKRIRKVIFAGLISAFGLTATSVQALPDAETTSVAYLTVGSCNLTANFTTIKFSNTGVSITIRSSESNIDPRWAGAANWGWQMFGGWIKYTGAFYYPVTTEFLQTNCGLIDVSALTQQGPDAASFAEEGELFLRFSARESATVTA